MKKILLLITLMHLPISAMEDEVHPPAYEEVMAYDENESCDESCEIKTHKEFEAMLYQGIIQDSKRKIKHAIRHGIPTNKEVGPIPKQPIDWAVSLARSSAVETLLENGANASSNCSAHLFTIPSCHQGKIRYPALKLIEHATLLGDMKSALSLIRHGANFSDCRYPNRPDTDIMDIALNSYNTDQHSCLELIQELFNHGYKFDTYNYRKNAWRNAIHNDQGRSVLDRPLVKIFLKNDGDINQVIPVSDGNRTPLALAVANGHLQAAEALIQEGANVNCILNSILPLKKRPHLLKKHTPLSYIQNVPGTRNNAKMIEFLKQHGAK